ncbi:Histone-lysine N-methyltransferase set9 [Linnemannia gamsii]|uniref:Histone-lysine N-methyltransferase set9 n=1 Tax=Linnemannia gamsii TaxID=64522 RepID=A0ABQ7KHI6_9FUNG|nr:Histone-lysine N-methyltransferase set9 [Linnemannia gamsii]
MDLQTLSTLDDLLSDVLLDGIHLWFQTHKMSKDYRPMRIPPGKILDIIHRKIICDRKIPDAVKELLEHARRYLSIYLPSAGFEISQTDRYSAVTNKSEACVIANRSFEAGDELRYCAGTIANLTEQEEKDLETKTSDFSVIKTSRRGTCLFLGPARFVNHDCDPNCSFMSAGSSAIYFKVQKPISVNDEITTHYGDNYFGVDNQECLLGQGGYRGKVPEAEELQDDLETPEPELEDSGRRLRNRRGKPVNYYPTLMKKGSRKPKEDSVRPSTPLPPVESDTIPSTSTNTPSTPITHAKLDSIGDLTSADKSIPGEISTIAVSTTMLSVASSTTSSDVPPTSPTELGSALVQSSIASPVAHAMELQVEATLPVSSPVSSFDAEKLASRVSSDQSVAVDCILSQGSVQTAVMPHPSMQTPSSAVAKLSMDDDSPFVDDTRSHNTQSSEDDTSLSRYPPAIDSASLPGHDKSSAIDNISMTDNASVIDIASVNDSAPLDNAPLTAESSSNHTLSTDILSVVGEHETTRTTRPTVESPEGLSTDSVEATVGRDQAKGLALVDMMTSLQLSVVHNGQESSLQDGHEEPRETEQEVVEHDDDDPAFSDQFDGDLSDAGIDEDIVMLSPKNFRMSLDFLCHTGARTLSTEKDDDHRNPLVPWNTVSQDGHSDSTNGNSRRASVQLSEVGDEMSKAFQKKVSKRAKTATVVSDPEHCATCKTFIPEHERDDSDDCRRCCRHFAIYGISWPTRSRHVIIERYKKAAQEERDRVKKKHLAEASRAAAKEEAKARQEEAKAKLDQAKEEVKAKQEQAKEVARAKQEQAKAAYRAHLEEQRQQAIQKIAMRKVMGLPPVEKTKLDLRKKRQVKPSNAPEAYHNGYSYQVDPSMQSYRYEGAMPAMAHADMISVNSHMTYPQIEQPHAAYQGMTNNLPGPYQQDYYYPAQQDYFYDYSTQPTMLVHPFHCAPYVVFVDPMDDNPDMFWWIAVTVPRHQMDESMPQCGSDPDLIVVRFLEEYAYAVCNISGLRLFHPEKEPYKSYASRGREFFKNPCVKRAMSFLNEGHIPPRLPWKNMSFVGQMTLPDIDKAVQDFPRKAQEMRNMMQFHQLRCQYQQSIQHLQHMRSNNSIDPFAIQEHELRLDQEYLHREEQLRCEMQQIGGSMEDYNTTSIAMVKRFALSFMGDNSMDIQLQQQHLQIQQQSPPTTKAKRSRKPKTPSQRDHSHRSSEPKPTSCSKDVRPPSESLESIDVSNPKSKKRRGPSKRQLQIDLQLSEHAQLLEAASMGIPSFKAADGTVFALASVTPVQVEVSHSSSATPKRKSTGSKFRVAGVDPAVQHASSMSTAEAVATTVTTTPKARRRRPDKQTVDVVVSDPPVSLPTTTLPRSISLEPMAHQLLVTESPSRFASLPGLLKTNDSKIPLSSTMDLYSCEYSLTESRVIEGRYNCVEITHHPARMNFVPKVQDGDAFLFDSCDLSGVSTPASSDSTETDVSLFHGGTSEPTAILSKSKNMRTYREDADWDECERLEADGVGIDITDNRSTTDTFGASELSSLMPSSCSSSLGEGDQDIDVVGYDDDQVPIIMVAQDEETQFIDIERLTPDDRETVALHGLLQMNNPAFDASSAVASRRILPMMVVWDHPVAQQRNGVSAVDTLNFSDTPKRAPKMRGTKKSRASSTSSYASLSTTSPSPPGLMTTDSISEQDAVSEVSRIQSRSRKAQSGKLRKASSSKSKVTMGAVKRQNSWTVADGDADKGLAAAQERLAITDKRKKITVKVSIEERADAPNDHQEMESTRRQRKKKRSRKEAESSVQDETSTAPVPRLLKSKSSRGSPSASSSPSSSSCPATESPEPPSSFSAVDVADNKELQSLMDWSIKGGIIGFDIESSVRSVRSRNKHGESLFVVHERPSTGAPKAKRDTHTSKPRVVDVGVDETKSRSRKRRKLVVDVGATQNGPATEPTASSNTRDKEAGNDSKLTGVVETEGGETVKGPVDSSGTEPSASETLKDKHTSDDSVATFDTHLAEEASDDSSSSRIMESRVVSGKVISSRKEPAIVMVKFTLAQRADSGEVEDAPATQDPLAVAESSVTSTERSLSSVVPKKRGNKKVVEVPDDQAFQRPVAMSTRKRSQQDSVEMELTGEEESMVNKSLAQSVKGGAEAAPGVVVNVTVAKRRRVSRSLKSTQDELPSSKDEIPLETDDTPSGKNESPSVKVKAPSVKVKASSEKDGFSSEKVKVSSVKVKASSRKVKALLEKDESPSEKAEATSKKVKTTSEKVKAPLEKVKAPSKKVKAPSEKVKASFRKGKALSKKDEAASEEEEDVQKDTEEEEEESEEGEEGEEEEGEEGEEPSSGKQSVSLAEKAGKRQTARSSRAPAPKRGAKSIALAPFVAKTSATTTTTMTRSKKLDPGKVTRNLVSRLITSDNIAEARLRNRNKEAKQPNTSRPKFEVGDPVMAPGEDNLMFECEIKARRDHEMLPEVYEYKVHYEGYAQKYDTWIEETLIVAN